MNYDKFNYDAWDFVLCAIPREKSGKVSEATHLVPCRIEGKLGGEQAVRDIGGEVLVQMLKKIGV